MNVTMVVLCTRSYNCFRAARLVLHCERT